MKLEIELTEKELTGLVVEYLQNILGDITITANDVDIMVKSKQNYRSEWEQASFKAVVSKNKIEG